MSEKQMVIGTAPDSWGVWFAEDSRQTSWQQFLDEVVESGYEWIELGPYGYLPTDASHLRDELGQRGLRVSAGTVFTAFHRGPDQWTDVREVVERVAALTAAVGGEHVVVIPAMWRDDVSGQVLENANLTQEQWKNLTAGHERLGRMLRDEFGLNQQFHPHADSHVLTQEQIERFLNDTDPLEVSLCLDTGHAEYGGASSADLIRRYSQRIGYLHLKQVHPEVFRQAQEEHLTWAAAAARGVMTEPPGGVPDLAAVIELVEERILPERDRAFFGIVEQDMYPCSFDVPMPIAQRTRQYLLSCSRPPKVNPDAEARRGAQTHE